MAISEGGSQGGPTSSRFVSEGKPVEITLEESARIFLQEGRIVIPNQVWQKVINDEKKNPIIGCSIGVRAGLIRAHDHDPDND